MTYYPVLATALFFYMTAWFVVSVVKRRNDVADIAWGMGFVVLSWLAITIGEVSDRSLIANVLVTVWGGRLAYHIFRRNRGKPEDYRYAAWRAEWGKWFLVRSYLQVYLLQGVLLFLIVMPVLCMNAIAGTPLGILDILGMLVWATGFAFESVGDAQLARFRSNPANKGKIIDTGLWRYSRHPNYFGEVTQWWGLYLMALSVPDGVFTIVGPITITVLILFVSGVPLLEKKYAGRPDFEAYKRRTSVFFPLPPRPDKTSA